MAVADIQTRLLTAHDLLLLRSEGGRGELIRGVLSETMRIGHAHGVVEIDLVSELRSFIKPGLLDTFTASDLGASIDHEPDELREPDIAYFLARKTPLDQRAIGSFVLRLSMGT
ncbi:MAG: Uma2 family endonuclease [Chloroflexi bacterium]|nr:Uma2 family endonuclease [Chloroflexota bacterium]